eukprot:scaffold979_cov221-Pinguiococcus_pyrenoidosus.AAC.3
MLDLELLGAEASVVHAASSSMLGIRGVVIGESLKTWEVAPTANLGGLGEATGAVAQSGENDLRRVRILPKATTALQITLPDEMGFRHLVIDGRHAISRYMTQKGTQTHRCSTDAETKTAMQEVRYVPIPKLKKVRRRTALYFAPFLDLDGRHADVEKSKSKLKARNAEE